MVFGQHQLVNNGRNPYISLSVVCCGKFTLETKSLSPQSQNEEKKEVSL